MKVIASLAFDLVGLAGAGVFLVGVHQVYPPAALILGGLGLAAGGLLGALKLRAPK